MLQGFLKTFDPLNLCSQALRSACCCWITVWEEEEGNWSECRQLSTVLVRLGKLVEKELLRKPAAFVLLFLGRNGLLWLWEQCLCILPVAEREISQVQSLRICSTIGLGGKSCSSLCQVSVSPTWSDGLAFFFFLSLHFLFLWIEV